MKPLAVIRRAMLVLGGLLVTVAVIAAGGEETRHGPPVDGLRLRLVVPEGKDPKAAPAHLLITIENVSDRDLNLRLGYSLSNGATHHPDAIELMATTGGETPRRLIYFNGMGGIAGRADPLVVPLPAGASYTLRVPFRRFVVPVSLLPIDPNARECRITAHLKARPVSHDEVNLDTQGQVLTHCWQGDLRSNEVRVGMARVGASRP